MITQYLSADGITAGTIEEGATIDVAKFPRIGTVTETIDQLAEICGFIWYIDFDKTLHFKSRTSETAPFNISDTAKIVNIQLKNDRSRYRNRQFIRGGVTEIDNSIVDEQPTPKPDGVTRTFVTRYPISQKPTIKINSVEVSPNDIGVNGVDGQGSPLKWYWSYNTNTVTQDDNETILSTSDTIEISYIGLIPLLVVVEDSTAITDRSGIERTSGIYESLENMPNINDKKQALDIAYGRLSKFTKVLKELTYQTFTNGLQVGQIQTVTLSKYNLSAEEFLIDRINIRDLDDNGTFVYDVHAIDGQSFGGWSNFFKNLIHQSNLNLVINNDEKLIAFKSINESETWSESYAYTVYACAVCAETLYPETTFYPC
jgi:hypothetical protein